MAAVLITVACPANAVMVVSSAGMALSAQRVNAAQTQKYPQIRASPMSILLRRVYDHGAEPKGIKVFVDRLWPRGISKGAAPWSVWLKDIAPSDNLRKWFAHDEAKWAEFKQRYFVELDSTPGAVEQMRILLKQNESVTLLYSAKNIEFNNAVALKEYLEGKEC